MSDVLWTDEYGFGLLTRNVGDRFCCEVDLEQTAHPLTPDECDSLAAALVQAAAKKRSEDRVRQLEQEGRASK